MCRRDWTYAAARERVASLEDVLALDLATLTKMIARMGIDPAAFSSLVSSVAASKQTSRRPSVSVAAGGENKLIHYAGAAAAAAAAAATQGRGRGAKAARAGLAARGRGSPPPQAAAQGRRARRGRGPAKQTGRLEFRVAWVSA